MKYIAHTPLLLVTAMAVGAAQAALAPDALFRQVSPSVFQVATFDAAGKPIASGSAVVIATDVLVTNCHVLKGAASFMVRQKDASYRGKLLHADAERDLCQITAQRLPAPPVVIAPQPAQVGQRIYTIGSPRGLEATLSDGLVSGMRRGPTGDVADIQISAPISPGSSGGGLFDDEGRLLGITTSGIVAEGTQNLNFARPATMIADIPVRAAAALARWRETQAGAGGNASSGLPAQSAPVAPSEPVAVAPAAPRRPDNGAQQPRRTPAPTPIEPVPPAAQPPRIASGFAAIDDVDAIPFLRDTGRAGYREFLARGTPRAFALATNGNWASAWGPRPRNSEAPLDAAERAVWNCNRNSSVPCKLYAVNNAVVWKKD